MFDNGWKVDNSVVEGCPLAERKSKVIISAEVFAVIVALTKKIKGEWQMYLIGRGNKATGYYIPEQEASSGYVKNKEDLTLERVKKENIIGIIHSHGGMASFFSSTDRKETASGDVRFSLVVNNRLDIKALEKKKLKCGHWGISEAKVEIGSDEGIDGIERIKEMSFGGYIGYGYGYGDRQYEFGYEEDYE